MNQLAAQQQEIETLKSQLKAKDAQIVSLEKLNSWYLEQLKLRRQKQFGVSSEKCSEDQIAIDDLFANLFNEAESLREPLAVEPEACKVIPTHNRKKAKRGSKFEDLPVEIIEYKLTDAEKVCSTCGELLTEMKKRD